MATRIKRRYQRAPAICSTQPKQKTEPAGVLHQVLHHFGKIRKWQQGKNTRLSSMTRLSSSFSRRSSRTSHASRRASVWRRSLDRRCRRGRWWNCERRTRRCGRRTWNLPGPTRSFRTRLLFRGGARPPKEVAAFVAAHRHHGVVPICRVLQVAPSAVRSAMSRPVCAQRLVNDAVKPKLLEVFNANYRVYG